MSPPSLIWVVLSLVLPTTARFLEKSPSAHGKVFDYYDVAKGNVPSDLVAASAGGNKPSEVFVEDGEDGAGAHVPDFEATDHLMVLEGAIEVQPALETHEEGDVYEEYSEDAFEPQESLPANENENVNEKDVPSSNAAKSDGDVVFLEQEPEDKPDGDLQVIQV